jgi:uncharacterized protein (TIGR02996 family)
MSDREALLAAIQAAPADDAPRLVYADWLDENGDPDLAEFIRLQVELDPLEQAPDTDEARRQRAAIRLHSDPPAPDHFPPAMHRYARLARRESELLKAHRSRWLGPLGPVDNDDGSHLGVTFRRGFAEQVAIATSAFLNAGDLVREACPLLRRLTLYGPRDQGPELAGCPALNGIPELDLAGWLTEFDARFLATTLSFNAVRSLTLWVGSRYDRDVIRTLASGPTPGETSHADGRRPVLASPTYLGDLADLVLMQPYGGMMAADRTEEVDRHADGMAAMFDRTLGRRVARVERPFARPFPLNGNVGYGLYAGRMDDNPTLVSGSRRPVLCKFDTDGRLVREETLDLSDRLKQPPPGSVRGYHEAELLALLGREYGFEPGPIFVREFAAESVDLSVYLWGTYEEVVEDPDARLDGEEHEDACASLDGYWRKGDNFVILFGNEYWAGPDGKIHAS